MAIYQSEMRKSFFGDPSSGLQPDSDSSFTKSDISGLTSLVVKCPGYQPDQLRATGDVYTSPTGRTETNSDYVLVCPRRFDIDSVTAFVTLEVLNVGNGRVGTLKRRLINRKPGDSYGKNSWFDGHGTSVTADAGGDAKSNRLIQMPYEGNRNEWAIQFDGDVAEGGVTTVWFYFKHH